MKIKKIFSSILSLVMASSSAAQSMTSVFAESMGSDTSTDKYETVSLDAEVDGNNSFGMMIAETDKYEPVYNELHIDSTIFEIDKEKTAGTTTITQPNTQTATTTKLSNGEIEYYDGHYYKMFSPNTSLNWYSEEEYCEKLGGHLLTINSMLEQVFIEQLIKRYNAVNPDCQYIHIGGYYSLDDDSWHWVDDSPFTYTNWNDLMPDNWSGNEYSLSMFARTTVYDDWVETFGCWNDFYGGDEEKTIPMCDYFICEWDSSPEGINVEDNDNRFEVIDSDKNKEIIHGGFSFPGTTTENGLIELIQKTDKSSEYCYSDSYFMKNSYSGYDPHLATMSLCLELSIWPSAKYVNNIKQDYENSSINAKNLFDEIGFKEFETNDLYKSKPTEDSMGVGIANKTLNIDGEDVSLLAVAVRGGGYEKEWASNFKIGASGDAQGFSEGKDEVLRFIEEYISEHELNDKLKFWIVGYSRGAAVANLTAAALNRKTIAAVENRYEAEDVYAYTFETPMATVDTDYNNSQYKNIHNIVNVNDIVPLVAPTEWGFHRYGEDYLLPAGVRVADSNVSKMLEKYLELDMEEYLLGSFAEFKLDFDQMSVSTSLMNYKNNNSAIVLKEKKSQKPQSVFNGEFIRKLSNNYFSDRETYYNKYQDDVTYLLSLFMGLNSVQINNVIDDIDIEKILSSSIYKIDNPIAMKSSVFFEPSKMIDNIYGQISNVFAKNNISFDEKKFKTAIEDLVPVILNMGVSSLDDICTLIKSGACIKNAHYPELCLAWLQSQDSNYTKDAQMKQSNGNVRELKINCPVDVKVFDSTGNEVASIVQNECLDHGLACIVNTSGEKIVYIPADEKYTYELTATDSGNVSITVNEISLVSGAITRIVDFDTISVQINDVITGDVPCFLEEDIKDSETASSVEYKVVKPDGESGVINKEIENQVANEYFSVSFDDKLEYLGVVSGSGLYTYGSFAQLEVIPYDGCTFEGWYSEDELLSTEETYRFKVEKDVRIAAEFSSETRNIEISVKSDEGDFGGTITGIETNAYNIGSIIEINAIAEEGYEFVCWESESIIIEEEKSNATKIIIPSVDSKLNAVFKKSISETLLIIGDVDGDGQISAMDASAALTYYVMNPATIEELGFPFNIKAADWDENGVIDARDASAILTYYVSH